MFPCDLGDVDGLCKRDAALDELHQLILRFIYTNAPGADTYITEEWSLSRLFNKLQVGNTRLNSFILKFQICTLIKYNQTNKYMLNADKRWRSCKHYPKSEYSTCLKILHPRLNIQNTLKSRYFSCRQIPPPIVHITSNCPFLNCKQKGKKQNKINVACAGLKNQSDRGRICYLPFNCGHSVYSQVIQVVPKLCTSNKYTVYSQSNENKWFMWV